MAADLAQLQVVYAEIINESKWNFRIQHSTAIEKLRAAGASDMLIQNLMIEAEDELVQLERVAVDMKSQRFHRAIGIITILSGVVISIGLSFKNPFFMVVPIGMILTGMLVFFKARIALKTLQQENTAIQSFRTGKMNRAIRNAQEKG